MTREITNDDIDNYIDHAAQEEIFYTVMVLYFRDEILDYLDERDKATAEGVR